MKSTNISTDMASASTCRARRSIYRAAGQKAQSPTQVGGESSVEAHKTSDRPPSGRIESTR